MAPRQVVCAEEATVATRQHTRPCSDCPWTRRSMPGWLGSLTIEDWIAAAHGESHVECHTLIGAQCAGIAIYRANVYKRVRDPMAMHLPADRVAIFESPIAFATHHRTLPVFQDQKGRRK